MHKDPVPLFDEMARVDNVSRGSRADRAAALGCIGWLAVLAALASGAHAQPADLPPAAIAVPIPAAAAGPPAGAMERARTYSEAVFFDAAVAFVPYVNDVLPMVGVGVRIARIHELWVRIGYFAAGDDREYGYGSGGYRVALRPGKRVRPLLGALVAAVPETSDHNAYGARINRPEPLLAVAATAGFRIEPVPWLGLGPLLALGIDSTVHPIGLVELAVSVALPQTLDGGRAQGH